MLKIGVEVQKEVESELKTMATHIRTDSVWRSTADSQQAVSGRTTDSTPTDLSRATRAKAGARAGLQTIITTVTATDERKETVDNAIGARIANREGEMTDTDSDKTVIKVEATEKDAAIAIEYTSQAIIAARKERDATTAA